MEAITKKIYGVRLKFDNEKVFNNSTREDLSLGELEAFEAVIKHEKKDGVYEIGDDLLVVLDNGTVSLKDVDHE